MPSGFFYIDYDVIIFLYNTISAEWTDRVLSSWKKKHDKDKRNISEKKVNFVRYSKASSRKKMNIDESRNDCIKKSLLLHGNKLLIILIKHCFKNLTTTSFKTEVYCISKQRWEFWPGKQKVVIHVHIADMQKWVQVHQ